MMLREAKLLLNLVQSHHILNLKLKFMYLQKKRVVDTTHSLKVIDLSFISEQLM